MKFSSAHSMLKAKDVENNTEANQNAFSDATILSHKQKSTRNVEMHLQSSSSETDTTKRDFC